MKNYTDLNIILDRSGSMSSIAKDMVGGIETFLQKEKDSGDDTKVSLFSFDNDYETVFVDKDIKQDIKIELNPRGGTALNDAIGRTIDFLGKKYNDIKEQDRPNRVLLVVVTDGFENSSKEYECSVIAEKVKHQREKYSWDFVFLGAGEKAVLEQHRGVGIRASSSKGFDASSLGIATAWSHVADSYQIYKKLDRTDVKTRECSFEFSDNNKQSK
jgi:uncharacterized protein YegL